MRAAIERPVQQPGGGGRASSVTGFPLFLFPHRQPSDEHGHCTHSGGTTYLIREDSRAIFIPLHFPSFHRVPFLSREIDPQNAMERNERSLQNGLIIGPREIKHFL